MRLTAATFEKTLARKCKLPFLVRFDRSSVSSTVAPCANASSSKGRASSSVVVPSGYGTGAGHVPERDCVVKNPFLMFGLAMTLTFMDINVEHATDDEERLDKSMDARSARMASGFWVSLA